jgi:IS1 family transposase
MAAHSPYAKYYCTDGYGGYMDIVCPGEHIRNTKNKSDTFTAATGSMFTENKSDTFTVEGINADLRHYITLLNTLTQTREPMLCAEP